MGELRLLIIVALILGGAWAAWWIIKRYILDQSTSEERVDEQLSEVQHESKLLDKRQNLQSAVDEVEKKRMKYYKQE